MPRLSEKDAAALGLIPKRKHKYGAKRTVVDGISFASQQEAKRYGELKMLHLAGKVKWFTLQTAFRLEGGVKYIADFVVCSADGMVTIEDAKGFKTPAYRAKVRQMRERWGIEVVEV